jgi:MFS family permease
MPFLLRHEGIPVETIAGIYAVVMIPFTFCFAWSPITDMLLSRRNWILASNLVAAILLSTAILLPRPQYLPLFTALMVAGNVAMTCAMMALGGLMAVLLPDDVRGKAAGWFQAGNIGCGPLLGGAALWLIERIPLTFAAAGIGLMSFLPALPVLFIHEPHRSTAPSRAVFRAMFGEIKFLLTKARTWLGFLLFLSPIGAGAAVNLLSAIGVDYHASPGLVLGVTGMPEGLIATVAGALIGGAISNRLRRQTAYILYGVLIASAAGAMAIAPLWPVSFVIGGLAYEFGVGLVQAAFFALALELSGTEPMTAGTRMALFISAANAPSSYMTWLDGRGYHAWGVRGMLGTDSCVALATAAVLIVVLRAFGQSIWASGSVVTSVPGGATALGP